MNPLKLAMIGCGRPWRSEGATGFGMNHAHMRGYKRCEGVQLVAVADINRKNAELFTQEHGGGKIYENYRTMLAEVRPDVVSIATWPHLHAEMVLACAEAKVKAVHCEKPMAITYGDARRMVAACEASGTQLTFNHQRRFHASFQKVRQLIRDGAIGQLQRMEMYCPNLYDWGTHWFDMINFYNEDTDAEWVIGQIDTTQTPEVFAALMEGQGLSHIKFKNDVRATLITGHQTDLKGVWQRLIGTTGQIEAEGGEGHLIRLWSKGHHDWQPITPEAPNTPDDSILLAIQDNINALRTGREPELSAKRALRATELIFATYESSRRRGRVDLPLTIEDSPLLDILGKN